MIEVDVSNEGDPLDVFGWRDPTGMRVRAVSKSRSKVIHHCSDAEYVKRLDQERKHDVEARDARAHQKPSEEEHRARIVEEERVWQQALQRRGRLYPNTREVPITRLRQAYQDCEEQR